MRTSITREVSQVFNGGPCNSNSPIVVNLVVAAQDDSGQPVTASYTYTMPGNTPEGPISMGSGTTLSGAFSGPDWGTVTESGGTITVDVTVRDTSGNATFVELKVALDACFIIG